MTSAPFVGAMMIAFLGVAGCRTAPLLVPDPIGYSHDRDHVRRAIIRGARRSGWIPEERAPGQPAFYVRYNHSPTQYAVVRIDYDRDQITFKYSESNNLNCKQFGSGCESIHKAYNGWILSLRIHVQQALFEPTPPLLHVPEALSIIRQVIEEQPKPFAVSSVDVTEERIRVQMEVVRTKGFLVRGVVVTTDASVAYFNNIGRVDLAIVDRWYQVRIRDQSGTSRLLVHALDETKAKRFVDAVWVMTEAASR